MNYLTLMTEMKNEGWSVSLGCVDDLWIACLSKPGSETPTHAVGEPSPESAIRALYLALNPVKRSTYGKL